MTGRTRTTCLVLAAVLSFAAPGAAEFLGGSIYYHPEWGPQFYVNATAYRSGILVGNASVYEILLGLYTTSVTIEGPNITLRDNASVLIPSGLHPLLIRHHVPSESASTHPLLLHFVWKGTPEQIAELEQRKAALTSAVVLVHAAVASLFARSAIRRGRSTRFWGFLLVLLSSFFVPDLLLLNIYGTSPESTAVLRAPGLLAGTWVLFSGVFRAVGPYGWLLAEIAAILVVAQGFSTAEAAAGGSPAAATIAVLGAAWAVGTTVSAGSANPLPHIQRHLRQVPCALSAAVRAARTPHSFPATPGAWSPGVLFAQGWEEGAKQRWGVKPCKPKSWR